MTAAPPAPFPPAEALSGPRRQHPRSTTTRGSLRLLVLGVLGAQLAFLAVLSAHLYQRFDLTDDFATFHQAWAQIAHGHLDPANTIQSVAGYPFWANHFELAMWPLAGLYWLWPHAVDLLWVQDVAIVATEAVAVLWVVDVMERRRAPAREAGRLDGAPAREAGRLDGAPAREAGRLDGAPAREAGRRWVWAVGAGALALLVANPWVYESAMYDFHFEPLGALFVVLAGRDLWSGRGGRTWVWVALALVNGGEAATYVVALGLAGVAAGRGTRRQGAAVAAAGLAWLALILALGAEKGSALDNYSYLAGAGPGAAVSLGALVRGAVSHPARITHMLALRALAVGRLQAADAFWGLITPWGLLLAAFAILPAALNSNPGFSDPTASFQTLVALPFLVVGTAMVLAWLAHRSRSDTLAAAAIGALALAGTGLLAAGWLPTLPGQWLRVDAAAASRLGQLRSQVPGDAEVIASQGIIGRFAGRRFVFTLVAAHEVLPVRTPEVVFVLAPDQGIESIPPAAALATVAMVRDRLHARVLVAADGIYGLAWTPPPGTTSVTLP